MMDKPGNHAGNAPSIFTSTIFWLFTILVLATILRLYRLDAESIWVDEAVTIRLTRMVTLSNIQSTLGLNDRQPPLYYFLLKIWLQISSTVFWIRLLSAIIGIFTVYLVFLLGKMMVNARTGIIAAFLLAISPYHIYYSQETRMYTLECFWFVLASYLLYQAYIRNKIKYWVGYVIVLEASLYTHYYTLFLILTHSCIVLNRVYRIQREHVFQKTSLNRWAYMSNLIRKINPLFYRWCLSIFVVFLGFIPLISLFHNQLHSPTGGWVPVAQVLDLFKTIHWFIFGNYFNLAAFSFQSRIAELTLIKIFIVAGNSFVYLLFGYIIWKLIRFKMVHSTSLPFLTWHLFGLMIFPWLISLKSVSYYFGQRYQLVALPFFLILLAYGINLIPQRKLIRVGIIVVILFTIFPLYSLYMHLQKLPWKDTVILLLKNQQKDDAVLLSRNYTAEVFEFYAPNQFKIIQLPELDKQPQSEWTQDLTRKIIPYSRIWWVTYDSRNNPVETWLNQKYPRVESFEYERGVPLRIILYALDTTHNIRKTKIIGP